jgi:hypothetical protein
MGSGESRAKASAAIEYARRMPSMTIEKAMAELAAAIESAKEQPTRSGGLL